VGSVEEFQGQVWSKLSIDDTGTDRISEPGTKGDHFGHHPKQRGEPPAEIIRPLSKPPTYEWSVVVCFPPVYLS
jgi:hypothetical protein